MNIRLGYLVPEFPGQTHAVFWRELQMLERQGASCDVISTRMPPKSIISHSWSKEAMGRTAYLWPTSLGKMISGITTIVTSGPASWLKLATLLATAEVGTFRRRLRLVGLAIAGAQVVKIARRGKWSHLHVHSCADSAHLALFAHAIGGIPYSLTLHGPLADYGPNQRMKWQYAAFGLVITHKLKEEVYAQLGSATPNVIEIAPIGVDTQRFSRKRPYVPWNGTGQFRIFSCGRLNVCKGHDDLIRALGIIREGGIDAILSIAGADDSRGQYLRYLQELIEELRLSDYVFLLEAVSEEEVMTQLESSHVFSLASLQEPLGVAIMEAMAMEVPVVVTRAGGVAELVDDGVDGLMVLPQQPAGLAAGLRRLASDPRLAVALTKPARSKIEHFFSSHRSADVLTRLVSDGKTSSERSDISNTA